MTDQDEALEAAAKKSWRHRRRIKRLLLGWLLVSLFFAEAGASWFGIFLATHAPMPLADAKLIAERTAMAVFVISLVIMIVSIAMQISARQRLRRLENKRLERAGLAAARP